LGLRKRNLSKKRHGASLCQERGVRFSRELSVQIGEVGHLAPFLPRKKGVTQRKESRSQKTGGNKHKRNHQTTGQKKTKTQHHKKKEKKEKKKTPPTPKNKNHQEKKERRKGDIPLFVRPPYGCVNKGGGEKNPLCNYAGASVYLVKTLKRQDISSVIFQQLRGREIEGSVHSPAVRLSGDNEVWGAPNAAKKVS